MFINRLQVVAVLLSGIAWWQQEKRQRGDQVIIVIIYYERQVKYLKVISVIPKPTRKTYDGLQRFPCQQYNRKTLSWKTIQLIGDNYFNWKELISYNSCLISVNKIRKYYYVCVHTYITLHSQKFG